MSTANTTRLFADLEVLLGHLHRQPEVAVRKWSFVECEDYQAPLALVTSVLTDMWLSKGESRFPIRDRAEYRALTDIVRRSGLAELLSVDDDGGSIRLQNSATRETLEEVMRFVADHTSGCEKG